MTLAERAIADAITQVEALAADVRLTDVTTRLKEALERLSDYFDDDNLNVVEKQLDPERVINCAIACHEANKAWCEANGDNSQKHWEQAEEWQQKSAIAGVMFKLKNVMARPEDQHNAWCESKTNEGWVYGEVKDADKKTHPCLVPYDQLPEFQKTKDKLFVQTVETYFPEMFNEKQ
jgi:hypothetical protein